MAILEDLEHEGLQSWAVAELELPCVPELDRHGTQGMPKPAFSDGRRGGLRRGMTKKEGFKEGPAAVISHSAPPGDRGDV